MIVPSEYYGKRLDVVLAQMFPDFSRSQLSEWLKLGSITLNQQILPPKHKVSGGESIQFDPQNLQSEALYNLEQAEAIPLTIVFEDEHMLIVNKPAGLVVHPGAGNPQHTLMNALLHHDENLRALPRAGIVHRLDKETTGLLLVAKNMPAHTKLIQQLQARTIHRHYLALVYGYVVSGGLLETFYGRHPRNRLKMAVCAQGKEAITAYTIGQHYPDFTLLNVKLMTGRTHQIRVHMAHINHPVVGDPLYGGRPRFPAGSSEQLRFALQHFKRQALHACSLSLLHPYTQEPLTCTAPLPDDFQSLLTLLDAETCLL